MKHLTKAARQRLEYSALYQAIEATECDDWTSEELLRFQDIIESLSTLTLRRWVHAGQKPLQLSAKE